MMKTKFLLNNYGRLSRRAVGSTNWRGVLAIIGALIVVVWFGDFIFRPLEPLVFRLFPASRSPLARLLDPETEALKERITALLAERANWQALTSDNQDLRQQLELASGSSSGMTVELLDNVWSAPYGILRARLSAAAAPVKSAAAVRFGQLALGRVVETVDQIVKIQLFSAPGVETSVRLGMAGVPAVATGRGGGNFMITLPRGLELAVGDWAYLADSVSGQLGLAVIGAIDRYPSESLQTVYLALPINLQYVRYLQIADN